MGLRHLDLSHCRIGPEACLLIATGLKVGGGGLGRGVGERWKALDFGTLWGAFKQVAGQHRGGFQATCVTAGAEAPKAPSGAPTPKEGPAEGGAGAQHGATAPGHVRFDAASGPELANSAPGLKSRILG